MIEASVGSVSAGESSQADGEGDSIEANVVKCRPLGNRDPAPKEVAACAPFLERQARLLRPAFVLVAGRVAAQSLLETAVVRTCDAYQEPCQNKAEAPEKATSLRVSRV